MDLTFARQSAFNTVLELENTNTPLYFIETDKKFFGTLPTNIIKFQNGQSIEIGSVELHRWSPDLVLLHGTDMKPRRYGAFRCVCISRLFGHRTNGTTGVARESSQRQTDANIDGRSMEGLWWYVPSQRTCPCVNVRVYLPGNMHSFHSSYLRKTQKRL